MQSALVAERPKQSQKFKGVKPGDVIEVQTKSEHGYALVTDVSAAGVSYHPIGGSWQGRVSRERATARQIKGVWRRLSR